MSESRYSFTGHNRPHWLYEDDNVIDAEIIEVRTAPSQRVPPQHIPPQAGTQIVSIPRQTGSGTHRNDKINRLRAGFGRSGEYDYPAPPEYNTPRSGFSAASTPAQGGGGFSGASNGYWDQPGGAANGWEANGWEANHPNLKGFITQDKEGFVIIGFRVRPVVLKQLAVFLAIVLLLIAIGIYNLPDIGIGNILDLVFAFR